MFSDSKSLSYWVLGLTQLSWFPHRALWPDHLKSIFKQGNGPRQIFLIILLWYYLLIMIFNLLIFNTFPEGTPISLLQMQQNKTERWRAVYRYSTGTSSWHRNPITVWENSNPLYFVCFLWLWSKHALEVWKFTSENSFNLRNEIHRGFFLNGKLNFNT